MNIGVVTTQLADLLTAGDVPQADGVVTGADRQPGAVRTERQAVHPVPVRQDPELFVRVGVPQPHVAPTHRSGGDQAAVLTVSDSITLGVGGQHADRALRRDIPEPHRPIISDAAEICPIGAEGHIQGGPRVAGKAPAGSPAATSQSRIEPSRLPEASSVPAGLKTARASPVQYPVGAVKTWRGLPAARSQRVMASPRVTVASWLPPGCQATELTIWASE